MESILTLAASHQLGKIREFSICNFFNRSSMKKYLAFILIILMSCSKSNNESTENKTDSYSFPYRVNFWSITIQDELSPHYQYVYDQNKRIYQKIQEYPSYYIKKQYTYTQHHVQIIDLGSNDLNSECELNDQGYVINEVRIRQNGYDSASFFYDNGYLKKLTMINAVMTSIPSWIVKAVETFDYQNGNLIKWTRIDTTFDTAYNVQLINNLQSNCEYYPDIRNTLNLNIIDYRYNYFSMDHYDFPYIEDNVALYGKFNYNLLKTIHFKDLINNNSLTYSIYSPKLDSVKRIISLYYHNILPSYKSAFVTFIYQPTQ
jgi:hypothetical protein